MTGLIFLMDPVSGLPLMKTIPLKQISATKGYTLQLNSSEEWLMEIFQNIFTDFKVDKTSIKGTLNIKKTNQLVDITGNIKYTIHPLCARCGNTIKWSENVRFKAHQAPLTQNTPNNKEAIDECEEKELTSEDLNFSYYKNEEIRIDTIINDEIALELPYNFYCQDVSKCRPELPNDSHITMNDDVDPRWAPLKDLKKFKN